MNRSQAALCSLGLLVSCGAISVVGNDKAVAPGPSSTGANVVASSTPAVNDLMELRVVLTNAQSTAPTPPAGFSLACSVTAENAYIYTHVAGSSENPNYGTVTWGTASGGAVIIGERSGVNTTTPISACGGAAPAGSVLSPSYAMATPLYIGSVAEGAFETSTAGRCTGGAGTCVPSSAYTEAAYINSGIFGEAQIAVASAPPAGNTISLNFQTAAPTLVRVVGYYDDPAVLATYTPTPPPCNGAMMMGMSGC